MSAMEYGQICMQLTLLFFSSLWARAKDSQMLRVLKYLATDGTTQLKLSSSFKQHSTTQLMLSSNSHYSTKLPEY